ncbi:MAG: EAL domain-containing protein [Alphaproteobacteria bacterium]|nr:EAL domain-containing protein [Alphaproteobacteria bacterium]
MNHITLHDMKDGLDRNQFQLNYQPKISLHTGDVIGAEALIRWNCGNDVIMPKDFIPFAEKTGFVSILTERVFELLGRDAPFLLAKRPDFKIAVNVSPHDFHKNRIVTYLETLERVNSIAPTSLHLEITEETATLASDELITVMNALREYGILFSLDDFGTGYSSLDILSRLPFSEIKLDQSLVRQVGHNPKAKSIVSGTIQMANRLNLHTVGEGIETENLFEDMAFVGCDTVQGFWLSHPLGLSDFIDFVDSGQRWLPNVTGVLYRAQMDHIQWRHDLVDLYYRIKKGLFDVRHDLNRDLMPHISDHHACKLGKWYTGVGSAYAMLDEYSTLDELHKKFHETGAQLLQLALRKDFEACYATLRDFSSLSSEIIKCLNNLEERISSKAV